jgi:hypothetical protein
MIANDVEMPRRDDVCMNCPLLGYLLGFDVFLRGNDVKGRRGTGK